MYLQLKFENLEFFISDWLTTSKSSLLLSWCKMQHKICLVIFQHLHLKIRGPEKPTRFQNNVRSYSIWFREQVIFMEIKISWNVFATSLLKHSGTFFSCNKRKSWSKYFLIFSHFNAIALHHNWNGTRLLSHESVYLTFLSSCRMTENLEGNFKETPEMLGIEDECPPGHQKGKFW